MKYVTVIALALFSIFTQGCAVDTDALERENPIPPIEEPNPGEDGHVEPPIERAEPPQEDQEGPGDANIVPPIEHAPAPEGADNDGDDDQVEVFGVDGGDHEDDDDLLDDVEDGSFGGSDGEDDGDDEDQDDGEDVEIGDECEPGQNQCDEGFNCEETCTPSQCDDEGRCTADCLITFLCVGNR